MGNHELDPVKSWKYQISNNNKYRNKIISTMSQSLLLCEVINKVLATTSVLIHDHSKNMEMNEKCHSTCSARRAVFVISPCTCLLSWPRIVWRPAPGEDRGHRWPGEWAGLWSRAWARSWHSGYHASLKYLLPGWELSAHQIGFWNN